MATDVPEIVVRLTEVEEVTAAIEELDMRRANLLAALSNLVTSIRHGDETDRTFWLQRAEHYLAEEYAR